MNSLTGPVTVSVIVPSFNQDRFLGACLDSILDNDADEILVFDGGSTDRSREILEAFGSRISWISEPDGGQTCAINKGLKCARGDILCYLNSDDIYYPGALARVKQYFERNPSARIVYGEAMHLYEDGLPMESYPTEEWNFSRLLDRCFICQPAVFWRRDVAAEFGFFDETLHFAMDYEYWLRVGACIPFARLESPPLAGSRLHAETKTLSQRAPAHREMLEVVRRHTEKPYRWLTTLAKILEQEPPGSAPKTYAEYGLHTSEYFSQIFRLAQDYRIPLDDLFCRAIAREMIATFDAGDRKSSHLREGLLKRLMSVANSVRDTIIRKGAQPGFREGQGREDA